jgi:hypothetical protein
MQWVYLSWHSVCNSQCRAVIIGIGTACELCAAGGFGSGVHTLRPSKEPG